MYRMPRNALWSTPLGSRSIGSSSRCPWHIPNVTPRLRHSTDAYPVTIACGQGSNWSRLKNWRLCIGDQYMSVRGLCFTPVYCHQKPTLTSSSPDGYVVASIYSFAPTLVDRFEVQRIRDQLHTTLDNWKTTGRIYVAEEGINAQMAYPREREAQLQELLFSTPLLHPLRYEWNQSLDQTRGRDSFPDLRVKVKRQIVADGLVGPTSVNVHQHWPEHLESDEFERQIRQLSSWKEPSGLTDPSESHSTTPQLVDMRNHYESTIGYFVGATRFDCDTYQEAVHALDDLAQTLDPTQPVLMYCTGGIRCSKAGAYLKSQGFASVKVLKGGITAYGRMAQERPTHSSLFVGKNFTFDARRGERISPVIVGRCHQCNSPCDTYTNCVNTACHQLLLQCPTCAERFQNTCGGSHCFPLDTKQSTPPYNYHRQVRPASLVK